MTGKQKPVRIGLIGLGKMGQNHLRVLSLMKSVELAFLFDSDQAVADKLANTYSLTTGSDLDKLLPLADAVVICTPTRTHGTYIRQSSKHVKRIFVEKPMTDSLAETQALVDFAIERDIQLQIGFIERYNPAVQQLKTVLDESAQVVSIDFVRTNKLSARITDVDVVTDLMIHDIDLALFLNGPVRTVSAHGMARDELIEFASAVLTHENGRFSRIQASRITEKKIRTIHATCVDMYVDCELIRKELLINRQSEVQQEGSGAYTISSVAKNIEVRPQESLLSELQSFVAFCLDPNAEVPSGLDAIRAADICEQIQMAILK